MQQLLETMTFRTRGKGFTDITRDVSQRLRSGGAVRGLVTLFIQHTSASLTIQENADPDVRTDLLSALDRLAPEGPHYVHTIEGADDMPAHIKTMLTATSLAIPMTGGRLLLGTWQGVYLAEHRSRPHSRTVVLHFLGELDRPSVD